MTPIRLQVQTMREGQGMTQAELSRRAGVRRATIIEIEQGRTSRIDFDVWERLADALGVSPLALVVHEPAPKKRAR